MRFSRTRNALSVRLRFIVSSRCRIDVRAGFQSLSGLNVYRTTARANPTPLGVEFRITPARQPRPVCSGRATYHSWRSEKQHPSHLYEHITPDGVGITPQQFQPTRRPFAKPLLGRSV